MTDNRMSFREKLEEKRKDTGRSQVEIARYLKSLGMRISQGSISNYENDTELLMARGEEFVIEFLQAYGFTRAEADILSLDMFRQVHPGMVDRLTQIGGIPASTDAPTAPHLGAIGAGWDGCGINENSGERRNIPTWIVERFGVENIFALDVVGDSMTCADVKNEIPPGSECFFHATLEPQAGNIIAVWLDDHNEGVLKVFRPNDGYTVLESYNREHKPIVVDAGNPGRRCGVYLGKTTRAPQFQNGK